MSLFFYVIILILGHSSASVDNVITAVAEEALNPERSHKVHNIILNPDKHSWCELKHIRQIVTHQHCTSKERENYVCVGTCFSYSVPQTEPETPGDELLDYCDSCQPSQSHWSMVTLDCEKEGIEYQVTKNIQMITNCSCSSCNTGRKPPIDNEVLPQSEHRIPELFYKMLPDSHLDGPKLDIKDELEYSKLSLNDLKKTFKLNPDQENFLSDKILIKDVASFIDNEEEEENERGFTDV